MPADIEAEKRAMRAEIRERRQHQSDAQRAESADMLTRQLDALVDRHGARTVSCYLSTPTEPDTRPFINAAIERGIRVLLPVTRADGLLDWTVGTPDGGEFEGLYGLSEPAGELLGPMELDTADLLFVPAAAVATDGTRLGWGRGYYDKTLGSMQVCPPTFAVVFDAEVVEHVPRELHDQPVRGAITPTRVIEFDAAP